MHWWAWDKSPVRYRLVGLWRLWHATWGDHQTGWPPVDSSGWIGSTAFRIRSRRWDDMAYFQYLFDDARERQSAAETRQIAISVDAGCC